MEVLKDLKGGTKLFFDLSRTAEHRWPEKERDGWQPRRDHKRHSFIHSLLQQKSGFYVPGHVR